MEKKVRFLGDGNHGTSSRWLVREMNDKQGDGKKVGWLEPPPRRKKRNEKRNWEKRRDRDPIKRGRNNKGGKRERR